MAGVEAMIAEMEKVLGTGENPPGSNQNYITKWYGLVGAWCNMTITYAAFHSGNEAAVTFGHKYAYTVAHAQGFKDRNQWHTDIAGIKRGDIVFFDWDKSNKISAIDHVGIVTGTSSDGRTVYTIEGNIGNVCARKVRHADVIAGYGRPKYAGSNNEPAGSSAPVQGGGGAKYAPFPGTAWFKGAPKAPLVERMGQRLVARGCGKYEVGPGPQWTEADRASYAAFQRKLGFSGADADGWPGKSSWDRLQVPAY